MKSVGKQLQEARLAKNWTPELAARETKIKVARLLDLEGDDYSNFTSPAYARGFVRTYARSLGLDEYRILRQLDNKLPEDDTANIVTDTGVAYLPETSMPPRVAHRNYAGLYIVMVLGLMVTLVIVFVLFEAYRVGELQRYFAGNPEAGPANASAGTNGAPANAGTEATARALPVDSNPPPPPVDTTASTASAAGTTNAVDTAPPVSVKALPVDDSALTGDTNAVSGPDAPVKAVRALPVDPSELANPPSTPPVTPTSPAPDSVASSPPRALPVDPSELTAPAPPAAPQNPPAPTPAPPPSARAANSGPVILPPQPAVAPSAASPSLTAGNKRLVLTATQDSFLRVTALDAPDAEKPLYAAMLHGGQSVGFDGHKFSINVGVPSAVNVRLDGVNYGPHSDQDAPETFTIESHQP